MDEETWKKGRELVNKMPEFKTNSVVGWTEKGLGDNFLLLCELLKGSAIPSKELYLFGDEKKRGRSGVQKMIF